MTDITTTATDLDPAYLVQALRSYGRALGDPRERWTDDRVDEALRGLYDLATDHGDDDTAEALATIQDEAPEMGLRDVGRALLDLASLVTQDTAPVTPPRVI